MNSFQNNKAGSEKKGWLAVIAITLGALSLVITEFLPVGLIPDIAKSFNVSEGTAGLALTSTALLGMIAAPLATIGIGRIDRRKVLLVLTLLLIVSNIISVVATTFTLFMIARVILGVGVGAFWAISIASAISLVPQDKAARASALVFSGISIGSVISVPAGAFLASQFDWKVALIAASILSVIVFIIQLITIPAIPMEKGATAKDFANLLKSWKVRTILLALILTIGGQYSAYTYVTPFLQQVTEINSNLLSFLLLAYGALGILGNFVAGLIAEKSLARAVIITSIMMFGSLLIMTIFGAVPSLAIIGLIVWAIAFGMAPISIQLWLSSAANSPEIGQATYTTVYQFSIGFGSLIGGLAVDYINLTGAMALGAMLTFGTMLVIAIVLAKEKVNEVYEG